MVKRAALALAVAMLVSVAASAMPEIVATPMLPEIGVSRVEVVIECSQPDCTNKCTAAYGAKLIRAFCQIPNGSGEHDRGEQFDPEPREIGELILNRSCLDGEYQLHPHGQSEHSGGVPIDEDTHKVMSGAIGSHFSEHTTSEDPES